MRDIAVLESSLDPMEIWPDMIFISFLTWVEARDRNVGKIKLARRGTAF